jgi:hypothetical protein
LEASVSEDDGLEELPAEDDGLEAEGGVLGGLLAV